MLYVETNSFFRYIYQYISYDDLDELTVRQIDGLYLMSKTYEIAELSIICKYLLGLELNVGNALECFYLATKTECEYKKAACMNVFNYSFI